MYIEKLPTGKYRIKKQIDGYRFSLFFDEKPTQKEIKKRWMSLLTHRNVMNLDPLK